MPDDFRMSHEEPIRFDTVRDELDRVPVIGLESDRELFLDLPMGGLAGPHVTEFREPAEREFLSNDFSHGI